MEQYFLFTFLLAAFAIQASADMSREDYLSALKSADRYVTAKKQREAEAERAFQPGAQGAVSAMERALGSIYQREYQVGDSWKVIAGSVAPPSVAMVPGNGGDEERVNRLGLFKYEVVEATPERIALKVTQLEGMGLKPADPKVESVRIVLDRRLRQVSKSYSMVGRADEVAVASTMRSRISGLEAFPLDLPEILTAERKEPEKLPELPAALRKLANQAKYAPNPNRATWFEQQDAFGRPQEMLWQAGDAWPVYLRTPQGVAILVRGES